MNQQKALTKITELFKEQQLDIVEKHNALYSRFILQSETLATLYFSIYGEHPVSETKFTDLLKTIITAAEKRPLPLLENDTKKAAEQYWYLSNQIVGMSLYSDRFANGLPDMANKLTYLKELGVNFLHLMPLMESPKGESDGGYAVSDFRKIDSRLGTLDDLITLRKKMLAQDMYLMLDIVFNHTSYKHEWAQKALKGDAHYQDFFYMFDTKEEAESYNQYMPEVFPESSPGSFTYQKEINKWVMTVFHHYQWDLNFRNPNVFIAMLDTVFFYANLGVDILRIDAPAFIWKEQGTTCQNLPKAHSLLQLLKACVQIATPGMALLGEAIVAPKEIMKYFGTGNYVNKECDIAYGATNMALQWDALATGDTNVMRSAQHDILQKPFGATWISYTRCHDDIGLGYDDKDIVNAGFNAYEHRRYLKDFYSGAHHYSTATGALFSVNPKTNDARISGSLASLCGLEQALLTNDFTEIRLATNRIILMQAFSFFIGGIPMLFYGDEVGYTNDYSFLNDSGKSYDNRWMHRPIIDWTKNEKRKITNSVEKNIFDATQQLIQIRKKHQVFADLNNIDWISCNNKHIASFMRNHKNETIFCFFNFSKERTNVTLDCIKEKNYQGKLIDLITEANYHTDQHDFPVAPYQVVLLKKT